MAQERVWRLGSVAGPGSAAPAGGVGAGLRTRMGTGNGLTAVARPQCCWSVYLRFVTRCWLYGEPAQYGRCWLRLRRRSSKRSINVCRYYGGQKCRRSTAGFTSAASTRTASSTTSMRCSMRSIRCCPGWSCSTGPPAIFGQPGLPRPQNLGRTPACAAATPQTGRNPKKICRAGQSLAQRLSVQLAETTTHTLEAIRFAQDWCGAPGRKSAGGAVDLLPCSRAMPSWPKWPTA